MAVTVKTSKGGELTYETGDEVRVADGGHLYVDSEQAGVIAIHAPGSWLRADVAKPTVSDKPAPRIGSFG